MQQGRLILGGGGSADDERPLLEQLLKWTGNHARILHWPMALPQEGDRHARSRAWVKEAFASLGEVDLSTWSNFEGKEAAELEVFDAIFLSGGCTYLLLDRLRQSGFDRALIDYFNAGGTIYGGSAGAIVLGCDIDTCAHIDRNICDLRDMTGLNLANGCAVACHYRAEHADVLQACAQRLGAPVVALTETNGLVLERGTLRLAGRDPAWRIDADAMRAIAVGEEVT